MHLLSFFSGILGRIDEALKLRNNIFIHNGRHGKWGGPFSTKDRVPVPKKFPEGAIPITTRFVEVPCRTLDIVLCNKKMMEDQEAFETFLSILDDAPEGSPAKKLSHKDHVDIIKSFVHGQSQAELIKWVSEDHFAKRLRGLGPSRHGHSPDALHRIILRLPMVLDVLRKLMQSEFSQ